MKAAAAYIIQADESTQKNMAGLMPHMLEVTTLSADHNFFLV